MQYKAIIAGLMATAVSAVPTPQDSDIVGGTAAAAGEFPFIVSLQSGGSHFCGGSLVDSRTVVTAAHCTQGQTASSLTIRAGSLNRGSGGVTARVSSLKIHPSFSSSTLSNDVAIWKLATAIPTSSTISYATLPASGSDPAAGTTLTVAGWGTTTSGGASLPAALRKVDVPVVSRATCRNNYSVAEITDAMFCAGLTAGGKDSCQGDSGGPIVNSSRQLVGLVSWGDGCAAPGKPGVYTRVGSVVPFITQNMG